MNEYAEPTQAGRASREVRSLGGTAQREAVAIDHNLSGRIHSKQEQCDAAASHMHEIIREIRGRLEKHVLRQEPETPEKHPSGPPEPMPSTGMEERMHSTFCRLRDAVRMGEDILRRLEI